MKALESHLDWVGVATLSTSLKPIAPPCQQSPAESTGLVFQEEHTSISGICSLVDGLPSSFGVSNPIFLFQAGIPTLPCHQWWLDMISSPTKLAFGIDRIPSSTPPKAQSGKASWEYFHHHTFGFSPRYILHDVA